MENYKRVIMLVEDYDGPMEFSQTVFKYKKPSMFNMGKGNEKKLWFNLNKLLFSYSDAKDQSDPPKASKVFSLDVISKVTIDLSKEAQSKYIIEIMTDKRNFRFKIKNLRGFFMIMEAFRHTKPKGRFDHLFNANLGYLERLHKFILEKGDQAQVPSKQTEQSIKTGVMPVKTVERERIEQKSHVMEKPAEKGNHAKVNPDNTKIQRDEEATGKKLLKTQVEKKEEEGKNDETVMMGQSKHGSMESEEENKAYNKQNIIKQRKNI